ncbi:MAG: glycosyltransferase family 87 protein [Candidatus Thorarchaeota archaeon]
MKPIKRFKELCVNFKFFRYTVILHLGYFVVSLILVLTILREQNDFIIYFNAGGIFYKNIEDLYNQEHYLWDYRYLPLSAMFFVPFYLLGFEIGFIVFHTLNLILNILICIVLYKICKLIKGEDHEKDDKRIIIYISVYLVGIPQMFNYILGQINLYITFFILISLYIFLKYDKLKWQFIGSLILGLGIILKPTALFLIPFLLVVNLDFKKRKKLTIDFSTSIVRLIGVFLPGSLNIILFLAYPILWEGFIETNLTGSNPLTLNFSFSITKLILNFCYVYNIPFNQLYVLIGVMSIIAGVGFIIFIIGKFDKKSQIIYGITIGILIMLLGYYDSWDHHLLNLTPLLIIMIFNLPRHSDITEKFIRKSLLFFNCFDLAFMGIWFLIWFYFPYNFASTIFLIMVFYGISKYALIQRKKKSGLKRIS